MNKTYNPRYLGKIVEMFIGKGLKNRSVFFISLVAGACFLALAVWGWGLELATLGKILLITLACLLGIILVALAGVILLALLKRVWRKLH